MSEESTVFLLPPQRASAPAARLREHTADKPAARRETQLLLIPPAPSSPPVAVEKPPESIDWTAEAEAAAKHQGELAAAPQARALDKQAAGTDFNGGLGPDRERAPEFGWDHSHTHKIESIKGGGMLVHVNDHCVIILFPLPFAGCGIGKIPVRGDLFEHMRDAPILDSGALNLAP